MCNRGVVVEGGEGGVWSNYTVVVVEGGVHEARGRDVRRVMDQLARWLVEALDVVCPGRGSELNQAHFSRASVGRELIEVGGGGGQGEQWRRVTAAAVRDDYTERTQRERR